MTTTLVYEKLEGKCAQYLEKYFISSFRTGYVKCKGYVLPEYFKNFLDQIRSMEVRPDDVWVCSIPKTGTTWAQEMVWCISNNIDLDAAKERMSERFPFLEFTALYDDRELLAKKLEILQHLPKWNLDSVNYVNECPSPRFIKSHLPFVLLPETLQRNKTTAKIVYVTRNPRDTCISYYHHSKMLEGYEGDFETFCELFLNGAVSYLPYWKHVLEYWRRKDISTSNILFITYEEMKKDLRKVIIRVAKFLGKTLTEDQVCKLTEHLSFESMKNNRAVNREPECEMNDELKLSEKNVKGSFMRCGQVGQWKHVMTPSMVERFEKWEQENVHGTDYSLLKNYQQQ